MVCTFNKAPNVAYFRQARGYYDVGIHDAEWYAPSGDFGISDKAPVDFDLLERLYAGVSSAGESLVSNKGGRLLDRQSAYDLTFSVPKSVSLLYAMGSDRERLEIILLALDAARKSLFAVERIAGWARRGRAGKILEPIGLTAAMFVHEDARPSIHADGSTFGDPDLHVHCVVLNLATRADRSVGAIQSVLLRNAKMLAGAVFHAALAAGLLRLRFGIDRVGKNGIFEVNGIPDQLIKFSSGRRQEIERRLEATGVTSAQNPALAAKETAKSRNKKEKTTLLERLSIWRDAFLRNGFNIGSSIVATKAAFQPISALEGEALYQKRLEELPAHLTENDAVVGPNETIRALNAELVGTGLPPARAARAFEEMLRNTDLVCVGTDPMGFPLLTTHEMIQSELSLIHLAKQLGDAEGFALDPRVIAELCKQGNLSEEQTRAALSVTGPGRCKIIEGAPGAGKSTALGPIARGYEAAGYKVYGAATAWKIATALGRDLGIDSRATAHWLALVELGKAPYDDKTVIIIDEAALLGTRETLQILQMAKDCGAKVILVGDRNQIQPIAAGPGLGLMARSVEVSRIETIVRQREEWCRQVVREFGKGEALKALTELVRRRRVDFGADLPHAVEALVERWRELTDAGEVPLLIARTNEQLRMISREVRRNRRNRGELADIEVTFSGRLPNQEIAPVSLSAGDGIRFLAKNKELKVINGTVGEVLEVVPGTPLLETRITARIGIRTITFSLSEVADDSGVALIGWDYGWSVFAGQGVTVEHALVLADANFDQHLTYVAASRARATTHLFVDAASVDAIEADLSALGPLSEEAERLIKLSRRMSRKNTKKAALDYLPREKWENWSPRIEHAPQKEASAQLDRLTELELSND